MADNSDDDRAARKARADSLRRARDRRNKELQTPETSDPSPRPTADSAGDNYVDFLDRKMRRPSKQR